MIRGYIELGMQLCLFSPKPKGILFPLMQNKEKHHIFRADMNILNITDYPSSC